MPPKAKAPASTSGDRYYPTLEEFIEQQPRDAVADAFSSARKKLGEIKGTKAAGAKKIAGAMDLTEQLLHHLYDVKENMAAGAGPKGRK